MNAYEAKLEQFQGPLPKLLELIEKRQLEITAISLAAVTEDFLGYLETLKRSPDFAARPGERHLQVLADFLSVASRLVLLKSKSLVPNLELSREEQEDLKDLELHLKQYRELKPLFRELEKIWETGSIALARPYLFHMTALLPAALSTAQFFYPGECLTAGALVASLRHVVAQWQGYLEETEVVREKIVSLEEQMEAIVKRLQKIPEARLTDFSATKSREELIVIFLALLHLARDHMVSLKQHGQFSDIMVGERTRGG